MSPLNLVCELLQTLKRPSPRKNASNGRFWLLSVSLRRLPEILRSKQADAADE
jgi:hypothetical protein